jgi:hypothetical protein
MVERCCSFCFSYFFPSGLPDGSPTSPPAAGAARASAGANDAGDEFATVFCFLLLVFCGSNFLALIHPLGLILQDIPAMHQGKLPLLLVFGLEKCTSICDLHISNQNKLNMRTKK